MLTWCRKAKAAHFVSFTNLYQINVSGMAIPLIFAWDTFEVLLIFDSSEGQASEDTAFD